MITTARFGLALASGVLWSSCFGARSALILPWIVLVPLLLLANQRRPAASGFLHGLGFWLASIVWIVPTLESYGGLSAPLALATFVLLCGYLALFHALFAGLAALIWRRSLGAVLCGLPALWVALEVVRARLFSGFPWNLAAYSVTDCPGSLELAAWAGAYGVSFLVLLANTAVAAVIGRRRPLPAALTLVTVGAALVLGAASRPHVGLGGDEEAPRVVVVQPNTPITQRPDDPALLEGYWRLLELSLEACEPRSLLIWPESAAWPFVFDRDPRLRADLEHLNSRGCSVLLNSASREGGTYYNSALLARADGAVERYDKMHLVPFGEYVPLSGLGVVRRLARGAADFSPGRRLELLHADGLALGVSICFEIIFPAEVAARVREGATLLVTVTNDAWYGDTAAPWQHFRAARFRAAENRTRLVRAALTGISGVLSAAGGVEQWLDVGEVGVLTTRSLPRDRMTFYTRSPWLVPALSVLLFGFVMLTPRRTKGADSSRLPRGRKR